MHGKSSYFQLQGGNIIDQATGKHITDTETLERVKKLRIPPAYKDVMVHKNPRAKLQAYGYDAKGRKQFIYNKWFIERQQERKYEVIARLHKKFVEIEEEVKRVLAEPFSRKVDEKFLQVCLVIYMMLLCNFRIGNEKYRKEHQHYGLTTLEWRHIQFENHHSEVRIKFVGKKGVINDAVCTDPLVIRHLRRMKKAGGEQVFGLVSSNDVNTYLKTVHPEITAKGIRLWHANRLFVQYVQETSSSSKAVKKVAEALHNTPAVCKSSYLHPELLKYTDEITKRKKIVE